MNVLSLFDGISCGRVALERAGIEVGRYYASEIDKYATAVSGKNYPDIIRLGDVTKWREWDIDWKSIDLLIGGSPCQGFSFAGKQLNFSDERSRLFFEFANILNHIKSHNKDVLFLLENVRMKKEYRDEISRILDVQPVLIDSALVSAQNRKRLYWTNIGEIAQPSDKGILLKDIVHEYADIVYAISENWAQWMKEKGQSKFEKSYSSINSEKAVTITTRQYTSWIGNFIMEWIYKYIVPFDMTLKILEKEVQKGKVGYFKTNRQGNRVYYIRDEGGGRGAKTGLYLFGCITPDRIEKRQNGQRFSKGNKFYTLTANDTHGVLLEGYIRKLTPIECERLQTLPDDYTKGEITGRPISDAQRYKMLGNGWTVDVIAHIFKHIKRNEVRS